MHNSFAVNFYKWKWNKETNVDMMAGLAALIWKEEGQ